MRAVSLLALLLALMLAAVTGTHASSATVPSSATTAIADGRFLIHRASAQRPLALVQNGLLTVQTAPVGSPAYLQSAYDLTALAAQRGVGDTVGIVDPYAAPALASDLATYRAFYGLAPCTTQNGCLSIVNQAGQAAPLPTTQVGNWSAEATMDVEAVSAICPNCHITLVQASSAAARNLAAAMRTAARLGVDQLSLSWSIVAAHSPFGPSMARLLGSSRVAVIAATGDSGRLSGTVNAYPAALTDVTAVGGATLTASPASARGVTESGWGGAGFGCDAQEAPVSLQHGSNCRGRAYADVSAVANPGSLRMYDSALGGWLSGGGTSLATPLVAAFEAIASVPGTTNRWAYEDAGALNHLGGPYAGRTGTGTISGDIGAGAPGFGTTVTAQATQSTITLVSGVYSNGSRTQVRWTVQGAQASDSSQTGTVAAAHGATRVQLVLSGLRPNTTYELTPEAVNASASAQGTPITVTTAP